MKLEEIRIPSNVSDEFLFESFGTTEGGIHTEGLVNAEDVSTFQEKLEELQDVWDAQECACNPGTVPHSFD